MDTERMERNVEQATASGAINENLNLNSITKCGVSSHELGLSDGANSADMLPKLVIGEGKCGGRSSAEHENNLPESEPDESDADESDAEASHAGESHAGESKPKIPRDGGLKEKVGLDSYEGRSNETGSGLLKDKFSTDGGKGKDNLNDEGSAKDKLQLMKEKKAALLDGKPEALDGKPEAAGIKPEPLGKPEGMIKKPAAESQGAQHDSGKVVNEDGGVKPWFTKEKGKDGGEKKDTDAVMQKKKEAEAVIEKKKDAESAIEKPKDADAAVEKKDAAIAQKKKDAEAIIEKKESEALIEKKKNSMMKDDFIKKLPDTGADKTSLIFSNPYEESKEALRVQKLLQGVGKY